MCVTSVRLSYLGSKSIIHEFELIYSENSSLFKPDKMANPLSLVKALPPSVVSELSRMGIKTTSDLLMHSDISLMHLLNVSMYTARQLLSFVVEHVAPLPVTALQLLRPAGRAQFHIHSPLPAFDALLLGSLPPSITEVCGAPGAGKTQFCLSCAAHASVEGSVSDPPFGIVYIDTEGAVDAKRLSELITICSSMHTKHSVVSVESCLRNIVVKVADDMERLVTFLDELEDIIVSTNVRLIVLDSIASVIRRHFVHGGTYEAIARSDTLARIASTLKRIADTFQIPILVTNQVSV